MAKRHRLIKKALESLGWTWEDSEYELNTIKDIDFLLAECNKGLSEVEAMRAELDDTEEELKKGAENMKLLKQQIEVEEYQELNPKAKVFKV